MPDVALRVQGLVCGKGGGGRRRATPGCYESAPPSAPHPRCQVCQSGSRGPSASIHWNRGPEKSECPNQTLRKAGDFDALAPTGASKFPSLPWIRATSSGRIELTGGDWWSYSPLAASGQRAVLSGGRRGKLRVFDASDVTRPIVVRELDVVGSVQSLTIVQGVAIASMGYDGIAILPVGD
jgi:hypothetical protein